MGHYGGLYGLHLCGIEDLIRHQKPPSLILWLVMKKKLSFSIMRCFLSDRYEHMLYQNVLLWLFHLDYIRLLTVIFSFTWLVCSFGLVYILILEKGVKISSSIFYFIIIIFFCWLLEIVRKWDLKGWVERQKPCMPLLSDNVASFWSLNYDFYQWFCSLK